jgi:hypothetical protein
VKKRSRIKRNIHVSKNTKGVNMVKMIDDSEYPSFWLPKMWALRNAIEGIPPSVSMLNPQKYSSRGLQLLWFTAKESDILGEKFARITPEAYRMYDLEKLFRKLVGHHPGYLTEEELASLKNEYRSYTFLYCTPTMTEFLRKEWLTPWNKVHHEMVRRNYD